ncbi:DUF2891 domain-containing protein [uncultured Erythrobacter sp.]|uniref:DUF2891 domain-containing protein n=1 Tax=uncultured Erythrobacter sp. TaxID=263913 RepID=UPI00262A7892|nr:DUF2891 domain-containing protein [uncultured Erythrobacter sp.]
MGLTEDIARRFARIALGHVAQEYPNKLEHVLGADADARTPRDLHPCFFGSFDWHSCVHSWWTLLTLRRLYPDMAEASDIDMLANATFTEAKLDVELAYLERLHSRGFERPYGWGWLLALHHEAALHGDRPWGARLEPLARAFAARFADYLPLLTYPITVGTHGNTAFALVLASEWAEGRDPALLEVISRWSSKAFESKVDYSGWEPAGDEFLSPVLIAALLMSRVMPRGEFAPWFDRLVIANGWIERECHPVTVSDRSDGKIAHLDGLNLSRAWCLRRIASSLADEAALALLEDRAGAHLEAAMPHVAGDYMGEHWLASFALLALCADS